MKLEESRLLVVMPDGYRVWPDANYDEWEDEAFFSALISGRGADGERVTVRGNHIARIAHLPWRPMTDEEEAAADEEEAAARLNDPDLENGEARVPPGKKKRGRWLW